jgi:hypothetical protein
VQLKRHETHRIHWNSRRRLWSVHHHLPDVGWSVQTHSHHVYLAEAGLRVYESGRKQTLETGVKNVHAYITGNLRALTLKGCIELLPGWQQVGEIWYTPEKGFYSVHGGEIPEFSRVLTCHNVIQVYN